ncbi:MAG: hypothetical protein JW804_02625 [Sedimentisphaerales bacterium]|nr:hypothetical protein [Sedimentisphaerales bacterium]
MIDRTAHEIQAAFEVYHWSVTLGAAIAFTFGGLVIWLAGLGMGRITLASIGAFFGCIAAYLIKSHPASMLLLGAVLGALVGLVFEIIVSRVFGLATSAYNLIISITSSLSGTLAVFLGLILLLMFKGSYPLSYITQKKQFYLVVACAMVVFGMLVQMILCKKPYQSVIEKIKHKKLDEVEPDKKGDWRNR